MAEPLLADPGLTGDNIEDGAQALQSLNQTGYYSVIPDRQRSVPGGYEIMKKNQGAGSISGFTCCCPCSPCFAW
ncbi:MAG: hypothetical protein PF442_12735 [Desulfobulbaceae bacterium]|nr:hypothetical protein [Desulfobulbaceae bacterium]